MRELELPVEVIDARPGKSWPGPRPRRRAGSMSAPGVGPVTALAYVATIDDPTRFTKSRAVGAYVGLTTRRFQSGEMDYSGRISKMGDRLPRSLLYEAANSLLTVARKALPLKDWADRIRRRKSHKKACVALARKLAVILHRMLITGEPFRWPEKPAKPPVTTSETTVCPATDKGFESA